ncbi:MAG: F0F1 ATP synthase subunit alpha [Oscillospiraceae bacterium]|nr:F0F1 ATP synthase subunit alpha [Oscillospiraceae bacterium]MDD4367911.1 F0F1 ATP synthase subunit alpha [Oscillospiraceae bacterium]
MKKVIRIVSASGIPEEKAMQIASAFAEHFGYLNTDLDMSQEIDTSLLGGIIVYFDDKRFDYSIKGRLGYISDLLHKELQQISGDNVDVKDLLKEQKSQLRELVDRFLKTDSDKTSLDFLWNTTPEPLNSSDKAAVAPGAKSRSDGDSVPVVDQVYIDEVGQVIRVADGIAYVAGLNNCMNDELLIFSNKASGIAMNLEEEQIGVVLLGDIDEVQEGSICKRTGHTVAVPVGDSLLGRVVDALGQPIDEDGPITPAGYREIEAPAASVVDRQPVTTPLYTGITAIDAMTPVGRGQRELIIGDRQTGKTAIVVDTIINQASQGVYCVYVAIGQKMSTLASVVETLRQRGAMRYTTIVAAGAADQASMQYIAPFSATAIAEYWMYEQHKDVLIVYDDLTKNAQAYRNISLLLRRPPGREAYPGDIFYLHSRLLERSAHLSDTLGGGSLTALPIVETQSGDISAYIPTNVISITDGQIYLETDLFFSGQRPAINVGLSVSRVGGAAQAKAMKKVAGSLRISLAQYNEIASFSQFGSDLDAETQQQLAKGKSLNEILKQPQYSPRSMPESVILLYLATQGAFSTLATEEVHLFALALTRYLQNVHRDVLKRISDSGLFADEDQAEVKRLCADYLPQWQQEQLVDEAD